MTSLIWKIRLDALPSIASLPAPGPLIDSGPLVICNGPEVSLIVPVASSRISFGPEMAFAWATAARRLPGPLSLVLVTGMAIGPGM